MFVRDVTNVTLRRDEQASLAGLFRFFNVFLSHFPDILKSAGNSVNADSHHVSVLRLKHVCVAYLMTSKLQNLQGHIKFWV
jgi:hypothetical protein